jgi:oligo-1,6-glucosidase
MQWDDSPNGGFSTGKPFTELVQGNLGYERVNVVSQIANKDSLFHSISRMVHIRKKYPAFGRGDMEWVETDNPTLAVYTRKHQGESLLIINNLSDQSQVVSLPQDHQGSFVNLFSNAEQTLGSSFTLQPYEYFWLKHL